MEDTTSEEEKTALIKDDGRYGQVDDDMKEMMATHKATFKQIESAMYKLFYVNTSFAITYTMRSNIFILFARTFKDDVTLISVFVYLNFVSSAIMSLAFGTLPTISY